jgi:hypothetical protein
VPINSVRRHRLLKRLAAGVLGEVALEGVWRAKQEATSATALPDGFPFAARLAAVGYTAVEDLDGADADELVENVSLSTREAEAVLTALAAIT